MPNTVVRFQSYCLYLTPQNGIYLIQMQTRDHMSAWDGLDHLEKELTCASSLLLGLTSVSEWMG